jgi:protoheme IX farnesyltransferase
MQSPEQTLNSLTITSEDAAPSLFSDLVVLTKARLSTLVLITTFVGFCLASGWSLDWLLLVNTLIGTALTAAAAAVLNQFIEADVDRLMARTSNRPLPAGRMRLVHALVLGGVLSATGFLHLLLTTNLLTALLAIATMAIYLFLYTPLKRRTALCTLVGAVSGAIPPVIGWTAVHDSVGVGAWILFGILFFWQLPHFLALAWIYRDEYAQAGFVMCRARDIEGWSTAFESLLFTVGLVAITVLPYFAGLATAIYLFGAIGCGAWMLFCAVRFFLDRSIPNARKLFFASIFYLPILLSFLVFTRI